MSEAHDELRKRLTAYDRPIAGCRAVLAQLGGVR